MLAAENDSPGVARAACEAMGCRFEFVITDPGTAGVGFSRALCEEAVEIVRDWHDRLTLFDAGSVTSQLNARAATEPVRVSDDVMALLLRCQEIHAASEGTFDPTVGPLMRQHGFRTTSVDPEEGAVPVWGMPLVELDVAERLVRFTTPGVELDFGGVAKGWALDEAADVFREAGVRGALLHGGTSSAIAIGPPTGERAFRIALAGAAGPMIELRDAAMSVSAPHGRTAIHEGHTVGHLIDPRTGAARSTGPVAAILGSSAATCDAWATALLVLDEVAGTVWEGSHGAGLTRILCGADGVWSVRGPLAMLVRLDADS